MDDLTYFIQTFIAKNRRERWLILANGKKEKLYDKLQELEKHLNEKCTLVQNNALEAFNDLLSEERIVSGTYIGREGIITLSPIALGEIRDNSLLICRGKGIAFFFHHEGWVWICREEKS
ncbi:Uncharacterised protein [Leminorella richardii]|uniref:Uncharacterized protein n=1 Tax=Leminorella richardii TaxID=158841 RepID=A0A2X4UWC1_9GAMM|nr:hypothetical protein [Leminorella richardii]SQI44156.1 Uncharacterised protein [Leminorella richardii]